MKISKTTTPSPRTTTVETADSRKTTLSAARPGPMGGRPSSPPTSHHAGASSFEAARPPVASTQQGGAHPVASSLQTGPQASTPQGDSFVKRHGGQLMYVSQVQGMPWLEVVRTPHGYAWRRTHIPNGVHLGAYKPGNEMRNDSATAQLTKGGWSQSTPPFIQQDITGCGPAVVAMLASSALAVRSATGADIMHQMGQVSTDGKVGSSPQEMAQMLGRQGIEVTQGVGRTDKNLLSRLDASLEAGNKIVALVDSNRIDPSGGTQPGTAHWIIVDGQNTKDHQYLVKNPATGTDYYVSAQQLQQSIAGATNQGGGFLAVSAKSTAGSLLRHNSEAALVLGDTPGTGSKNHGAAHEASTG